MLGQLQQSATVTRGVDEKRQRCRRRWGEGEAFQARGQGTMYIALEGSGDERMIFGREDPPSAESGFSQISGFAKRQL